jgi:Ca2+-binding RTX toxin-like protein
MRKIILITGLIVLTGALVSGLSAAALRTIPGTAKNDVLKGSPKADRIDGKAGNDRLYGYGGNDVLIGGAGNDRLVGGPGTDSLRCGAGKDTAIADDADTVAGDCETVSGRTTTPPPETAPPPGPVASKARPGHYCGFTNQGKSICYDVTPDSLGVMNFDTGSTVDCGDQVASFGLSFGDATPIQADLSFSYTYKGPIDSGDPKATNIKADYTVSGKFDTEGNATGTLFLGQFSFDYEGTHFECAAAPYAWQAKLGA